MIIKYLEFGGLEDEEYDFSLLCVSLGVQYALKGSVMWLWIEGKTSVSSKTSFQSFVVWSSCILSSDGFEGGRIFSINSVWSSVVASDLFKSFELDRGFFFDLSSIFNLQLFVVCPVVLHKKQVNTSSVKKILNCVSLSEITNEFGNLCIS